MKKKKLKQRIWQLELQQKMLRNEVDRKEKAIDKLVKKLMDNGVTIRTDFSEPSEIKLDFIKHDSEIIRRNI